MLDRPLANPGSTVEPHRGAHPLKSTKFASCAAISLCAVLASPVASAESPVDIYKQAFAADLAGDLAKAVSGYRRAVELDPMLGRAWINLGIAQIRLRRYEKGRKACERALEIDPHAAKIHYCVGLYHARKGNQDEAARSLEHAIKLDGDDPLVHVELAHVLRKQKRYEAAVERYRMAVRLQPSHPDLHVHLGYCYKALARWEAAEVEFTKAVQQDPKSYFGHLNLGTVLVRRKAYDRAKAAYTAASVLRPKEAAPHYNLGNLALRRNDYDSAMTHFARAVELEPGAPRYRLSYARLQYGAGQAAEAKAQLIAARDAGPKGEVKQAIERLLEQIATSPTPPRRIRLKSQTGYRSGRAHPTSERTPSR